MNNKKLLKQYLEQAGEVYGRPVSDAMVEGWFACLGSVSVEQFEESFWTAAGSKFPTPSDLLAVVANINPRDDWDVVMMVACGRAVEGVISGYAAAALKRIGGIRKLAAASETETKAAHKEFMNIMAESRPTNGLPPAEETISLLARQPQSIEDFSYKPDHIGEHRANALIKLLKNGGLKPAMARKLAGYGAKVGETSIGTIPQAQRDRVLAAAMEIESRESDPQQGGVFALGERELIRI